MSLELFWLREESLEDAQSLAAPDALERFAAIAEDVRENTSPLIAEDVGLAQ